MRDVLADPELRKHYREADCVFFDCDGVIFDSNGFKIEAMRRTLASHAPEQVARMEEYWRAHGGASRWVKFEHFFTHIARAADVTSAVRSAVERFGALSRAAYEAVHPIRAALALARATGAERCHVVSGAAEVEIQSVFESKGIAGLFATLQGSPRAKRELVESVMAARGTPPERALLIGDGAMDFRVSRELGLRFVYLAEYSEWTAAERTLAAAPRVSCARSWADLLQALGVPASVTGT